MAFLFMHTKYLMYTIILILAISACSSEDELVDERLEENPVPDTVALQADPGSVNFGKYVAIGNSITAGFMDGALYSSGQANAYTAILGKQFQIKGMGGGAFNQPDINAINGFNTSLNSFAEPNNAPYGHFVLDIAARRPVPLTPGDPFTLYAGDKSQLNNFGVPGARLIEALVPGYAQYNPFFARFAASPGASMLADAAAAKGTFFTVWLGNNDVLGWAISGGSSPDGEQEPGAQDTLSSTLTSIGSFQQAYAAVLNNMLAVPDAKGVALTIPPITLLPYFRAINYKPFPKEQINKDIAAALNQAYAQYNSGLDTAVTRKIITVAEAAYRKIAFQADTANLLVMQDKDLQEVDISEAFGAPEGSVVLPKLRMSKATDLLLFPLANVLGQEVTKDAGPYGLADAVADQYVLTLNEQVIVNTRIVVFNTIIAQSVAATGGRMALTDINPIFADITGLTPEQAALLGMSPEAIAAADGVRGLRMNGVDLLPDFSPNGIMSTDGIHPNPKGHALVANEIIKTINASFGANIPPVDLVPYRTVIVAGQ